MTFKNPLPNLMQPLQQALDRLPSRDRKALLLLSVFILLLLFGLGLWSTHRAAQNATQAATDARELLGLDACASTEHPSRRCGAAVAD